MKKIYFLLGFIALTGLCAGGYVFRNDVPFLLGKSPIKTGTNNQPKVQNTIDHEEVSSKIEELRKKFAIRGLIYEGEAYLQNDQYGLALKQFNDALTANPGNKYLIEKIAETYFTMNKYESAYTEYKKIENPNESEKEKILLSLLYSNRYSLSSSLQTLLKEVQDLQFDAEKAFYYNTIFSCGKDFHGCKKTFQDYFSKHTEDAKFSSLREINETFKNYENFKLEDMYYKNALFVGTLFKQKLYPLVIQNGLQLNKEKPDYRPIIEMIAQSFYEMGEYKSAKIWLETYLKYQPNDKNAWYMMGVINLKIGEYILSNIQLQKAFDLGYEPKIQLERRLAYNYYILQQQDRMIAQLDSIITNLDFEKEDLYLDLYYNIINGKYDTALKFLEVGNKKFPDDENIYGYYGWIFKERGDLASAIQYIEMGLDKNPTNPFLLLNLGFAYKEKGILIKARIYFNKVIKESPNSEFAKQAQTELDGMQDTSSGAGK